jgi:peptide/nickel transport system substrate-binding protein
MPDEQANPNAQPLAAPEPAPQAAPAPAEQPVAPVAPEPTSQAPPAPAAPAPAQPEQPAAPAAPAPTEAQQALDATVTTAGSMTTETALMEKLNAPKAATSQEESKGTAMALKMPSLSRMGDIVAAIIFLGLISVVSYYLFYVTADVPLYSSVPQVEEVVKDYDRLTVVYDQGLSTYEPTVSDLFTRAYMANTYEGLVRFDVNLNIEPALALSWGMLDDTTWQFKLRQGVKFHDGSTLDAKDVVESIDRAQNHPESEIQNLVASVDEVVVKDSLTLHFKTTHPDPILLNKLTALPIIPSEMGTRIARPIGSGPYEFESEGDNDWNFVRNNGYWGGRAAHPNLTLSFKADKFDRYEGFLAGEIDVLAQVPPVFVEPLLAQDYKIASQPSLDVSFLMFGWENANSPFRNRELRDALRYIFDPVQIDKLTGGFAEPIGQFVSRGIFGYDPDIDVIPYDLDKARELIEPLGNLSVTLDLPKGLEAFGEYIQGQLRAIGLRPSISYKSGEEYSDYVMSGKSDFFFFGWRSDLGDAGDFFTKLVHSKTEDERYGSLNDGRYSEETVDDLIETMDRNLLETQRNESLQGLMDFVVNEEIIGVPLFETDVLVGIQPDLRWNPRVDNFILAADFK